MPGHGGAHIGQQLFIVPGFLNEVGRARLHGPHRVFDRAVSGDHDHRDSGVLRPKLREDVEPIAVGKREIQKNQVEGPLAQPIETLLSGCGGFDVVALQLQQRLQGLPDPGFVVDDQHSPRDSSRLGIVKFARNDGGFRH